MRIWLGLAVFALGSTAVSAKQTCDTNLYPLSAPTARFADHHDGTVTDTLTHMTWMRCAVGQQWNGAACAKSPAALSWQAAIDTALTLNKQGGFANRADWRVPAIPELATIVERQCTAPRINEAVFPGTPAAFFWTASTRRGKGNAGQAYILSFGPEGVAADRLEEPHYVRLLRSGP